MMKLISRITAAACAGLLIAGVLAACTSSPAKGDGQQGATQVGQRETEQAFGQQQSAVPYPVDQLKDSVERRNLRERLLRFNNPSKIGYVYVVAPQTGAYLGFYSIKGKVSSTDSQMTTNQLIVPALNHSGCDGGGCQYVVNGPGDDGSYGANENGVFFFTTEDVMIELSNSLGWFYLDAPLDVPNIQKLNPSAAPSSTAGH